MVECLCSIGSRCCGAERREENALKAYPTMKHFGTKICATIERLYHKSVRQTRSPTTALWIAALGGMNCWAFEPGFGVQSTETLASKVSHWGAAPLSNLGTVVINSGAIQSASATANHSEVTSPAQAGADAAPIAGTLPPTQPESRPLRADDGRELMLAGEIDLARLVDLVAAHLDLVIDYDPAVIRGTVTLRGQPRLTSAELWRLTNQSLGSRGFTTVKRAGDRRFSVVRLQDAAAVAAVEFATHIGGNDVASEQKDPTAAAVRHPNAAAHVESTTPGFRVVLVAPRHLSARTLADSLGAVFLRATPTGGTATGSSGSSVQATDNNRVLIADVSERVAHMLAFIARADTERSPIVIEEYEPRFISPSDLAALAAQILAKRDSVRAAGDSTGKDRPNAGSDIHDAVGNVPGFHSNDPPRTADTADPNNGGVVVDNVAGEVLASPNGTTLLIIAPRNRVESWKTLIVTLDRREPVETVTYAPRAFAAPDVARLIEQTARSPLRLSVPHSPQTSTSGTEPLPSQSPDPTSAIQRDAERLQQSEGSRSIDVADDRFRVVVDELTGTLLVTATPTQHARIRDLLARLDESPGGVARPVRAFPIRNRPVSEILGTLSELVTADVDTPERDGFAASPRGGTSQDRAMSVADDGSSSLSGSGADSTTSTNGDRPAAGSTTPAVRTFGPATRRGDPLGLNVPSGRFDGRDDATSEVPRGLAETRRDRARQNRTGPDLVLTADQQTNTLIAVGEPRMLSQIETLLRLLDVRQPQVMLRVFLVSLNDTQSMQLGVEIENLISSGSTRARLASLFGLSSSGPNGRVAGDALGFTGVVINPGELSIVIRALQTLNEGQSLSVPKVLVNNNEQAQFSSVLQQPFTNTNLSNSTTITSFGGFQDAGTIISVRPQIAEGDHLVLEYSLALSSFVGAPAAAGLPPPRQQNRVDSIATVPDGHTVVVGGLEVTTEGESESRVPLLGAIPVLGEAFKSRTKNASRTRFFVFIQPTVLRHDSFEDLKFMSETDVAENRGEGVAIDKGWPDVQPRMIK